MFSKIADGLKTLIGLSGVAYLTGFMVVNASFLARGIGEGNLLDATYIGAGAIFLFLGIPATLFPYLKGLAALSARYQSVAGTFISDEFQTFYADNETFLSRNIGPFLVVAAALMVLPGLAAKGSNGGDRFYFLMSFTIWYLCACIISRLAAVIFNLGFYWRVSMVRGGNVFWASFRNSFMRNFRSSFESSFTLTAGRKPTDVEVEDALKKYVGKGLGSHGFLASALYKGVALFVLNALTFGWILYPLIPASIGGGKNQMVTLLVAAEKSRGLTAIGLPGKPIAKEGKTPNSQWLTPPLPLVAKTGEAYYVTVPQGEGSGVVKIPLSSVEGVFYGDSRR